MTEYRRFIDSKGNPLDLVLYKFDACPYCRRVQSRAEQLGYDLPVRDTWHEEGARDELVAIGGKSQVPCLVINGEPLYESLGIIRFLESEVRPAV